jgi:hypothetical protein
MGILIALCSKQSNYRSKLNLYGSPMGPCTGKKYIWVENIYFSGGEIDFCVEASTYISRPQVISGGLHLYIEASTYIWMPPLISRGLHLYIEASTYISKPPLIYRCLHLYLEASTYILWPPLISPGLYLFIEASTCISQPPLVSDGDQIDKLNCKTLQIIECLHPRTLMV